MKKLILLVSLFLCFCTVHAQGNLEFNRVVYTKLELPNNSSTGDSVATSLIVPPNKVLKVESISPLTYGAGDGVLIFFDDFRVNTSASNTSTNRITFPIWLPEGSYKFLMRCVSTNGCNSYNGILSALEFNITQ